MKTIFFIIFVLVFNSSEAYSQSNNRKIKFTRKAISIQPEGYPWDIDSMSIVNDDSVHYLINCYKDSSNLNIYSIKKEFENKAYFSLGIDSASRPVSYITFSPLQNSQYEYKWIWNKNGSLKRVEEYFDGKLKRIIPISLSSLRNKPYNKR